MIIHNFLEFQNTKVLNFNNFFYTNQLLSKLTVDGYTTLYKFLYVVKVKEPVPYYSCLLE